MANHILELLGAYQDGELHGRELKKVEAHLGECQICAEEYASLQSLSEILQEALLPEFQSPERFAADVTLRLPRKADTPMRARVLEVGWWMAPIGLIVIWVFLSTTNLVSDTLLIANKFGLLNSTATWLVSGASPDAYWSTRLAQFGFLTGNNLQWAGIIEGFTRTTLPKILRQVSVAILYLGWITIWWARHTRQGLNNLKIAIK